MDKKLALGSHAEVEIPKKKSNLNDKIEDLHLKLESITEMFRMLRKQAIKKDSGHAKGEEVLVEDAIVNKDGLPLNTSYIGVTSKSPYPYILVVDQDGTYRIGNEKFTSLSAAAAFVSGVRRSGWTFWRLLDGRTIKEVYRDK
jgi:hypothetical protein